jgi:hypothetical protein
MDPDNQSKPTQSGRKLDPEKLLETSGKLAAWITTELPGSHLASVAQEVQAVTREALARAEAIRRPNFFLRAGLAAVLLAVLGAVVHQLLSHPLQEVLKFLDDTKGWGIYAVGFVIFFVTLEVRLKRRKALQAVHELLSLAHIIDMHQLAKDPELERFRKKDEHANLIFAEKRKVYLHACTALLALVSKIGQLYVDHFPDAVATRAVNDFEEVANGMAMKIWSKLQTLER